MPPQREKGLHHSRNLPHQAHLVPKIVPHKRGPRNEAVMKFSGYIQRTVGGSMGGGGGSPTGGRGKGGEKSPLTRGGGRDGFEDLKRVGAANRQSRGGVSLGRI